MTERDESTPQPTPLQPDPASATSAPQSGDLQPPKILRVTDFLTELSPDYRLAVYNRVTELVQNGTITGLIHRAGYQTVEMRTSDHARRPRKVREILILNTPQLADQLTTIEAEARHAYLLQTGARLDLPELIALATEADFEIMAANARTAAAKTRKHRPAGKTKPQPKKK